MTRIIIAMLVTIGVMVGFVIGQNVEKYTTTKTCETFGVDVVDPYGRVYIGHIGLCGYGLEWGEVRGPISKAQEDGKWN